MNKNIFQNFKNQEGSQRGFFRIIGLIIIAAIILAFLGYNPITLWTQYGLPAFQWIWNIFLAIISFAIEIIMKAVNIFKTGDYPTN